MALADLKVYYNEVAAQRNQMKEDLNDFEEYLKEGLITEDRLKLIKEDFEIVDTNYSRLSYVMWLLEIPNRKSKRKKFYEKDSKVIKQFSLVESDKEAVILENEEVLKHFRDEINSIKAENKR